VSSLDLAGGSSKVTSTFSKPGFPLAVVYKYIDDQGGDIAALITYYAFVSLFPHC